MNTSVSLKALSQYLFDLFVVDDSKYGRQQDDGTYKLIREKISVVTIDDMLLHGKSLLVYQEFHTVGTALIKWICIDLDISKKSIDQNEINSENLLLVYESAAEICNYLDFIGIHYLLEFSGRRGFHLWIIFEELQTKDTGFKLVNFILSKVTLQPSINADKFPKTKSVNKNTKMVGFGIKLPLSQNKRSKKLSYFLRDLKDFDFNGDARPSALYEGMLQTQISILENYQPLSNAQLAPLIAIYDAETEHSILKGLSFLKTKSIKVLSPDTELLDNVLLALNQCDHIREMLTDYQKGITGKNRALLVGLLGRLQSAENPNLGYNLLLELFSKVHNFRRDITEEKLKLIKNLFPVTCNQLGRCSYCSCQTILSPVQLISNVVIEPDPPFSINLIDNEIFQKIVRALEKYMFINDEIPLYHQYKKLENISFNTVAEEVANVLNGNFPLKFEAFEFLRNENDKVRKLYSIDHINTTISTYFLFILNNLYYTEISDNSFGYRLSTGFHNSNIFSNWFINWSQFSKKVSHILKNAEFADYYIVKIDIKNFYDRIDLQRLEIELFEEAVPNVALKIEQLSDIDRQRYKNIIRYFTELSRKTTGNSEYGLPQGPAYARYLAELYLLGLDRLIEKELIKDKKREFYYRFVDDIFVFVETEAKAKDVLKLIDQWASVNNLELNKSKTEIENVGVYDRSGKFQRFQDDAKYLINKANKNKALLSESEIQEALSKLDSLTNDIKFGLKDNIRFFYFQFSGDTRLNFIKKKLIKFLPYAESGRGTLFMMFYADLIKTQPEIFWSIANEQHRLVGLSLGHYLNNILFHEELSSREREITTQLIMAVGQRTDLSYAHKSLLLTLSRKHNLLLPKDFLKSCPKPIINSAMETPEIAYTQSDYTYVEERIRDKDKRGFVNTLYELVLQHPFDIELARQVARYVITRFSIWSTDGDFNSITNHEESALEYYHCLCFFTLFYKETENSPLLAAWKNLLSTSNKLEITGPIKFEWLNRAVVFPVDELSKRNCFALLLANKEGSGLDVYQCPHEFLQQFQNILMILLFSSRSGDVVFDADALQFLDPESHFGNWLKDINARLYPDSDNLCVKNLALNGIIVLENDTHLFIKKISSEINLFDFDYLSIDYTYKDEELELKKEYALELFSNAGSFTQYLLNLQAFLMVGETFRSQYNIGYPVYYKVPFVSGIWPLIPFYSYFEQKISPYGITQTNDLIAFWENADYLTKFNNGNIALLNDDTNPYDFKIKEFNERFFPKSELVIKTVGDKIKFLQKFVNLMDGRQLTTMYEYEDIWSQTIWQLLVKAGTNDADITKFLQVHFSNFEKEEQMPLDILFSVSNKTVIQSETLARFFETIIQAFISFQSQLDRATFRFSEFIENEKTALDDYFTENYSLTTVDFKQGNILFRPWFNTATGKQESRLIIDNQVVEGRSPLYFEREPIGFYSKSLEELVVRVTGDYVYYAETAANILIYVPEREYSKAFSRIKNRKAVQADGNTNYRKLFPNDENFLTAQAAYDGSKFQVIEANLSGHYSIQTDVKERVINWLTIINEQTIAGSNFESFLKQKNIRISQVYRAILETVALHYPVSDESVAFFKDKLKSFIDQEALLLPLKHPGRDQNGLSRLLHRCEFSGRELDFEKNFLALSTSDCSNKKLVILLDATTQGTQATKALNHYLKEYQTDNEFLEAKIVNQERYFEFKNRQQASQFRENIAAIKDIVFLAPGITNAFKKRLSEHPVLSGKRIQWESFSELTDADYLFGHALMNVPNREIMEQLLLDRELLKNIFIVPERINFDDYNTDPKKMNILLRVGSLPTMHMRIFSMQPRNGSPSLMDYIDNWRP